MRTYRIGVCSWSLERANFTALVDAVRRVDVDRIQLALDPVKRGTFPRDTTRLLAAERITVSSGMIALAGEDYSTPATIQRTGGLGPDTTWEENRAAIAANAAIARGAGIDLVTLHAGFIPAPDTTRRRALIERITEAAALFEAHGIRVGFETGQERADDLLALLHELGNPRIGVNFDPANVILYGTGDPIAALRALAPHVFQVHIKDALPPRVRGEWGTEVPVGSGAVDWTAFFLALETIPREVELMIEREAGATRIRDIKAAADFLRHLGIAAPLPTPDSRLS